MATGDILQTSAVAIAGATSLELTTSSGEPSNWTTPSSGNTLIAVINTGATVSSFSGWTQRLAGGTGNQLVYLYEKASAGTESTITCTISSSEDAAMTVYEIEGTVTWDVGAENDVTGATSMNSGSTGTLSGTTSLAICGAHAWDFGEELAFDSSYTTDTNAANVTDMDYQAAGHKALTGTTATSVGTSWTNSADGVIGVGVWTVSSSVDDDAPLTSLAATGTFPAVTTANQVNAAPSLTALTVQATLDATSQTASGTAEPASLYGLVTFPAVAAEGSTGATPTPTVLAATSTFPAVTAFGVDGEVVSLTPLAGLVTFPVPIVTGVINATASLTVLAVTTVVPTASAVGQESGTAVCSALVVTVTFDPVTTTYTWNATATLTVLPVQGVFPTPSPLAADLSYFYNTQVTIAVEIGFSDYPLVASPAWTDISGDVRSFTISRGRGSELDEYRAGLLTVILDNNLGRYDPTSVSALYYPNLLPMRQVRVRASYNFQTYTIFRGFVEAWPMQVRGFTDETVTIKAVDGIKILNMQKDSSAQSAENSGARVSNLLDRAGWPAGLRTIGTGVTSVPSLTPDCATILSLIKQVKDSEAGQFYIQGDGSAVFRNRTYRGGLSSQATFGDSAGEVPYQGIKFSFDDKQIWNRIEVHASGFPSYSSSTASQDKYGIRTLSFLDILLPDTTSADDLADIYRNRYAEPKERIESLVLKPEKAPALMWPQALGRVLSDKVTVNYHTNDNALKSAASYIEGIHHRVTVNPQRTWTTTFTLSQYE
jgi:hypothetical protein